ncbi:MAG: ATPase [Epulopiscium sp. Nele67-Bin005]|nr:MAG: ATPase [Epulopiscium sp. Nele67-Bin005]
MVFVMLVAVIIAGMTIENGVRAIKNKQEGDVKRAICASIVPFSCAVLAMFTFIFLDLTVFASPITDEAASIVTAGISVGEGFKYLAAALSTGLATIGTGRAVGAVGSAAIGAVSEDPSILGKTLIFVGMAEGIAIYGMIISILILFV